MTGITSLVYVTGNKIKFNVAARAVSRAGIVLVQCALDVPEIQSSRVEDVAIHSVIWASQHLGQPVVVTDAGFYIEALNGFPGPLIRYANEWFSVQDYLNLMGDRDNRRVIVRDCLAFCQPGEDPVMFCQIYQGELATRAGRANGTSMDQLFIPAGGSVPISEMSEQETIAFWSQTSVWQELKEYLANKTRKED